MNVPPWVPPLLELTWGPPSPPPATAPQTAALRPAAPGIQPAQVPAWVDRCLVRTPYIRHYCLACCQHQGFTDLAAIATPPQALARTYLRHLYIRIAGQVLEYVEGHLDVGGLPLHEPGQDMASSHMLQEARVHPVHVVAASAWVLCRHTDVDVCKTCFCWSHGLEYGVPHHLCAAGLRAMASHSCRCTTSSQLNWRSSLPTNSALTGAAGMAAAPAAEGAPAPREGPGCPSLSWVRSSSRMVRTARLRTSC
jgi:hypothetical protein